MPEAVASISIPAPEGQPVTIDGWLIALEDTAMSLHALGEMVASQLETQDERLARGFFNIYRREVADLDDIRRGIATVTRSAPSQSAPDRAPATQGKRMETWPAFWIAVRDVALATLRDAGSDVPDHDDFVQWPDHSERALAGHTGRYFQSAMAMLDGRRDPFEAGSLLPWLELRMRRDLGLLPTENGSDLLPVDGLDMRPIMDRLTGATRAETASPVDRKTA